MDKWYKGVYRRQLVDMHISNGRGMLSKFSPEEYVNCQKTAHIQAPMIYIQAHTGLCYYPTKTAETQSFFRTHPDDIRKTISLCRKEGMKPIAYYSLIYNNYAAFHHPEWQMIMSSGETWQSVGERYGLCCPNSPGYRDFVSAQIREISEQHFDIDGIFYDQPFYSFVCYCPACRERMRKETGFDIPEKADFKNPVWNLFNHRRQAWMGEFCRFVKDRTNEYMPGKTVEFNYAAGIANDWVAGTTDLVNKCSEFTGGDLYGDLYAHSFASKYYYGVTENQPFEYMTCRCNNSLREHSITKPERVLEAEIMLTSMHHGASLSIDAINPDGTLDKRVYKTLGKAFEKMMPYEKYMDKGELYSEVALYFDSTTHFSVNHFPSNKECAINAGRTLTENNILYRVLGNGSLKDLSKYQMILLPGVHDYDNPDMPKFIEYVKNGGTLYLSGASDKRLMKEFFGADEIHFTFEEKEHPECYYREYNVKAYMAPVTAEYRKIMREFTNKYPLPLKYDIPYVEGYKGTMCARLVLPATDPLDKDHFVSIHSNPPMKVTDKAVMLETSYGKGKVLWSAAAIENDRRDNFKEIFVGLVKKNITPLFEFSESFYVEPIVFRDGDDYYVSFFDLNHENDPIKRNVEIHYHGDGNYRLVSLSDKKEIPFINGKAKAGFRKYAWYRMEKIR